MTTERRGETIWAAAPRHTFGTILVAIIACVLVFGGFYMMGLAFSVPGWEIWLFCGGILVDAFGLWLAMGWLPGRDQKRAS
ncbi:hypothetical protein OOT08_05340 [Leucobacter sp. M11]|nr:hypothetical protein [Leucobacter sp. M11]